MARGWHPRDRDPPPSIRIECLNSIERSENARRLIFTAGHIYAVFVHAPSHSTAGCRHPLQGCAPAVAGGDISFDNIEIVRCWNEYRSDTATNRIDRLPNGRDH